MIDVRSGDVEPRDAGRDRVRPAGISARKLDILRVMAEKEDGSVFLSSLRTRTTRTIEELAPDLYDLERDGLIRRDPPTDVICLSYSDQTRFRITPQGRRVIPSAGGRLAS